MSDDDLIRRGDVLKLQPFDHDGDPAGPFDHHVFVLRSAIATLPAASPEPVAVAVKPLVWEPYPNPVFAGPDVAVANVDWTVPYTYQVQRDPWAHGYMAFSFPKNGSECWTSKGHETIEIAKAAAQADYEARILAALELTPQPAPEDDPPCTCCGGTGVTYQTERRCACQPAPDYPDTVWQEARAALQEDKSHE